MKIINFTEGQGSEEWHKWRHQGIGASDISVIMGSNPYKTQLKLWNQKCGFVEEDGMSPAMQHGVDNEPIARRWLNDHLKLNLQAVCVEDMEKSYFKASLDGFDFDEKTLVEIKCPVSTSVLDAARETQSVPDYWFDQMQWQIMLSQPNRAIMALWDYRVNACIMIDMFGHTNKILRMREEGEKFWHRIQIGNPPDPQKGDYIDVEGEGLEDLLLNYVSKNEEKKNLDKEIKAIKTKIESYGDDGNFIAYGFKIVRVMPSPRYDVKAMKEDGIDIDKYMKKNESIGFYRIFPPKN